MLTCRVKLGEDPQGNLVAIKKYKKETATLDTLKHELGIMKVLDHENLVKLISVRENATYKTEDESTSNCFAIVLEFVGGGELFDFVAETGKFSEKVSRTYFHQMMNGLHYMHQKGFAHRDIKPENLLLSHLFILKLADFGFSTLLKGKDGSGVLRTKLGTEGYMAPEIPTKKYEGKSVDIFAAGVILFIMYAGNPPFEKAAPNDPYYKILKDKKYDIFWKAHSRKRPVGFFSDSFKDLFTRMVAFNPTERPSIEEIANHPWIKEAVCTHVEIKDEFTKRQQKLDAVLEQRRIELEKERAQKQTAVSSQGQATRSKDDPEHEFCELYNKEFHLGRKLPTLEVTSKDDVVVANPTLVISLLKEKLSKVEIALADEDEEEIGDETDVLKVSKIEDEGKDKVRLNSRRLALSTPIATKWMRSSSWRMWRWRCSWA